MMRKFQYALWTLLAFAMLAAGSTMVSLARSRSASAPSSEIYRQLDLFGEVLERVRADYVEKPEDAKLIESAITDPTIKTYDTDSTAIQDLALGDGRRLDAVISALPTLQAAIDAGTPIKIVGQDLYYEPLAVAIDRSSELDPSSLVDRISEIVDEMHEDGTLEELSAKWYGTNLSVAPRPTS